MLKLSPNLTALNTDDKWRINKLQGNSKNSLKEMKQKEVEEQKKNEVIKEVKPKTGGEKSKKGKVAEN